MQRDGAAEGFSAVPSHNLSQRESLPLRYRHAMSSPVDPRQAQVRRARALIEKAHVALEQSLVRIARTEALVAEHDNSRASEEAAVCSHGVRRTFSQTG
jgi:hypothetical protein